MSSTPARLQYLAQWPFVRPVEEPRAAPQAAVNENAHAAWSNPGAVYVSPYAPPPSASKRGRAGWEAEAGGEAWPRPKRARSCEGGEEEEEGAAHDLDMGGGEPVLTPAEVVDEIRRKNREASPAEERIDAMWVGGSHTTPFVLSQSWRVWQTQY